jgi:hypothetical protein
MAREPLVNIVLYDPTMARRRMEAITEIVLQIPDISIVTAHNLALLRKELGHNRELYLINTRGSPAQPLINILSEARPEEHPPLILLGQERTLDDLLGNAESLPLANALRESFDLEYISSRKSYLQKDFKPALTKAIAVARNRRVSTMASAGEDVDKYGVHEIFEGWQLASLALTMDARAADIAEKLSKAADIPHALAEKLKKEMKRCQHYASTWMRNFYDEKPADENDGRVSFKDQVTEQGGESIRQPFRDIFMRHRTQQGAEHLALLYTEIGRRGILKVPGPDSRKNRYPIIPIDSNRTVIVCETIHGPTPRMILRERNEMQDAKDTAPHLRDFNDLYCERTMQKVLQDLTVYERNAQNIFSLIHRENNEHREHHMASLYAQRAANALEHLLATATPGWRSKPALKRHDKGIHEALRAMDPFDETTAMDRTLIIDNDTIVCHRDNVPANMTIRRDYRLVPGRTELEDIYHRIMRAVDRDVRSELNKGDRKDSTRQLVKGRIDAQLDEKLHHYDFGDRLALLGEDLYQYLLDADNRFGSHIDDPEARSEHIQRVFQYNLLKYLVYDTVSANSPGCNPFMRKEFSTGQNKLLQQALAVVDVLDAAQPKEQGLFSFLLNGPEEDAKKFIKKNGGRDPNKYTTHFDWMWYYRSLRDADLAVTIYINNTNPKRVSSMMHHSVQMSLMPLDRMRKRCFDEANKSDNLPRYYKMIGYTPASELQIERIFDRFVAIGDENQQITGADSVEHMDEAKNELHMLRLDYLAAMSVQLMTTLPKELTRNSEARP